MTLDAPPRSEWLRGNAGIVFDATESLAYVNDSTWFAGRGSAITLVWDKPF